MFRSLASRLTVLYTLLFAALSLIVFGVTIYSLQLNLANRVDQEFIDDGHEFVEIFEKGGVEALGQEIILETEGEGNSRVFIRVYSPALKIVKTSDMRAWDGLESNSPKLKTSSHIQFETVTLPSRSSRARIFYQPLGKGYLLQGGMFLDADESLLASFQQVFLVAFSIMLLSGVSIGFFISRRALAGVQKVRETADQISRGDLTQPISFNDKTEEVNDLILAINRMQQRIHALIKELQEVSNNIAHDLRSPITRIRGLTETTLTGEQNLNEYRGMAGEVIEECDSMVGMINTMLEIAETDAGVKSLRKDAVNIAALVRDVSELYAPVGEDKNIKITLCLKSDLMPVSGDRSLLQRALANLLDNALKFTQPGGRVVLEAKRVDKKIVITVADSGQGISSADLPHVCERFYRADRSRSLPGSGLGLSLVQSIVSAHQGELDVKSKEGAGTQVTISFDTTES